MADLASENTFSSAAAPASDRGGDDLSSLASQSAYDAFFPAAVALDPRTLLDCRADVDIVLAYDNVKRAVDDVLAKADAVALLPGVNLDDVRSLPVLVQGLAWAADLVFRDPAVANLVRLFDQAESVRRRLRKAAAALALAGFLPPSEVESTLAGGPRDVVRDCARLARLFRDAESQIAGHSPLTGADLFEAEQLGAQLGPDAAGNATERAGVAASMDVRDRFFTLLQQRHEILWRCGAWLHGRDVDDHVPQLATPRPLRRRVQEAMRAGQSTSTALEIKAETEARRERQRVAGQLRKFRSLIEV